MTLTTNSVSEKRIKKLIPIFVVSKLAVFTGFLFYMMQG
tara:strand:+ start:139 stop:255 length:117 start_codon:yes stop_codon:yes gene_type:complete